MHPLDALVLCALTAEREGSFATAVEFMLEAGRDDCLIIHHPSVIWWCRTRGPALAGYMDRDRSYK